MIAYAIGLTIGICIGMIIHSSLQQYRALRAHKAVLAQQKYIRELAEERRTLLWQNRIGRGL